ncbi:GlsB/YeaQ/YmgE family stress response membrane protein [Ferrimonas gelatinilytica]|uniref:GlsB/YeaQ/YmgE family stress response membrane protein n=1 Tax=Ferrimonas gelatinilytica TaxID=1255257 RepID=A0ABP9RXI0_9GAMM
MSLLAFLVIGAIAGWLAGKLAQGRGFGLLGNMVIGVVGSVIGGFTFKLLGLHSSTMAGSIVTATVGAVILLFVIGKLKS